MEPTDQFDLDRFVEAQDEGGTFDRALEEIRAGRKTTHWMWFVFPQIKGLGQSRTARHFAIDSIEEARAYLKHPVLGPRLIEVATTLTGHAGAGAERILGGIDAMKLKSSMTLFALADPGEPVFGRVLELFYDGRRDERTVELADTGGPQA